MKKTIIISLGGSLIVPDQVDLIFLKKIRKVIAEYVASNNRVVLVCGGGSITREYQRIARKLNEQVSDVDLDWLGIRVTRVNAELVKIIFGDLAYYKIIKEPKKVKRVREKVIIAAGWKPGWSTDYVAAKCAQYLSASEVINMSNVDYVYDRDPRKHNGARKITNLSWREMKKIVGTKWSPGAHQPFDPVATQLGAKLGIKVVFLKGSPAALAKYLNEGKVRGTIIGQ